VHEFQTKRRKAAEETFTLDGKFLRDEAREAFRGFFMPFSGVYAAAIGKDVRVVRARNSPPDEGAESEGLNGRGS
jgi:hypothetical protein